MDGLERLAPAVEERDHVRPPRQVAHQVEDAVPLAREHEAGAHDQVAARVAEALERAFAARVVVRRLGVGGDRRDEDEARHPGPPRRLEEPARAVLVHPARALAVGLARRVGAVHHDVGAREQRFVERVGQLAAADAAARRRRAKGRRVADQRPHLPSARSEVGRERATDEARGAGQDDGPCAHPSRLASSVPTRSAFAIRLKVRPFGGIHGKIEPSAR